MGRKRKATNFTEMKVIPEGRRDTNQWTDTELLNLVTAVQKYGLSDTKKIAEAVKTKSENVVKYFLSVELTKVRTEIAHENGSKSRKIGGSWFSPGLEEQKKWPTIRKWRRVVYSQLLRCVKKHDYSKILLEDLFETFYKEAEESTDPQVVNVKAVYKFLLDTIRGYIPGELSPLDSGVVLLLLGQLKEMQRDLDFDEEMHFIKSFKRARPFAPIKLKDEFREKTKTRSEEIGNVVINTKSGNVLLKNEEIRQEEEEKDAIMVVEDMYVNLSKHRKLVQSFNPLNVPMWSLVKEQGYVQNKCELAPRETYKLKDN